MIEQAIKKYLQKHDFQNLHPKAVFFDMDGVLFDSMPHHAKSWVKAMNDSGLPFTEQHAYMNEGQKGCDTINGVFVKKHGREATEEEKQAIYDLKSNYFEALGNINKIPFAYQLLQKVKSGNLQIYVVTGSAQPTLLNSLFEHFPEIFIKENIISAFDVKNGKPNPDPYLKALEKAGAEPWEAVVIENAPLGVQASSAAKIFTIGVNTGPLDPHILTDNGADIVYETMERLFSEWDNFNF